MNTPPRYKDVVNMLTAYTFVHNFTDVKAGHYSGANSDVSAPS